MSNKAKYIFGAFGVIVYVFYRMCSMAELPDQQEMLTEEEIDGSPTPNPRPAALWKRMWRASITAIAYVLLYTLSQVTVSLQTFL